MSKYREVYEQGKFYKEMEIYSSHAKLFFGHTWTQSGDSVAFRFAVADSYEEAVKVFEEIFKEDRLDLLSVAQVDSFFEGLDILCIQKESTDDTKM